METIVLREDLRETLERDAARESRSISDLLNEAVEKFLDERRRAQLEIEIEAYKRMHPELKQKYFEHWVAVYNQQLVDHDADGSALYRRVRAKYGREAVLIRQVEAEADPEIWIRTPRTGKIET